MILKVFKMACLSYSPTNITYKGHSLSRNNMLDCIKLSISSLKNKLEDPGTFESVQPPLMMHQEDSEVSKLYKLSKEEMDVPWPRIDGNLPIQNPNSISPRVETERTGTETNFPFTKRTYHTNRGRNTEIKQSKLNFIRDFIVAVKNFRTNFQLPPLVGRLGSGKEFYFIFRTIQFIFNDKE